MTISARTVAKIILVAIAIVASLYLLWLIRTVIGTVFISIFLAVALGPAVDFFQNRLRARRSMAIVLTYMSLFVAVFGVALLVVPPIVNQTDRFVNHVPGYIDDLRNNRTIQKYDDKYDITPKLKEQADKLPSHFGDAATALQNIAVGLFNTIITVVTVLVMTFFLLLDGRRAFDWFLGELDPQRGERVRAIADDVYRSVGGYVVGNLTISLIAGVATYIVLTILAVPFSVPLAVLMAFLDLIPLVGASIAGIAIGIVAAVGADFPARRDHLDRLLHPLPAGGEQPAAAADLPAHRRPAPAARDRRDPDRRGAARDRRRAAGDSDRRGVADRRQGLLGRAQDGAADDPAGRRRARRRHAITGETARSA